MQRAFGLDIPQTLEDVCDPARLALVVYDMQVGIVKQIENGQQITNKVVHLIPEMNPLPSEAIFDKITMSAFEATPLDMALRDCGIDAFTILGVALEIGIEPTVRHGADLGYIPVIVKDACGFGHCGAAERSIAGLEFAGDALFTNVETICAQLTRASPLS
jgi:nicotinamidase-related amidase